MSSHSTPSRWRQSSLSDLAQYHNGLAFKPNDWGNEGTKIIRIEQLNNPTGAYDYFDGHFPDINRVHDGDLLFSWSATLKVVIWKHGDGVLNQHLFKVVPNGDIERRFLFYLLDFNMDALSAGSHGSTMKHIKRSELKTFVVDVPPLPQQRKIARILTTVDNLIEKTEALIAKYQAIKQGMMHDLFTRGVDEHGQLRPTYEEAPELYKQSELGWIPKDWEIYRLDDLTLKIVDGVHHTPHYVDYGIPFVTVKNLTSGDGIDLTDLNYVSVADHRLFQLRANPSAGDVLVTKDGTLGVARIVPNHCPEFSIFVSVAMLRPNPTLCIPKLIWLFFDGGAFERQLGRLSAGTGLRHIHLEHFREFRVATPALDEQHEIFRRVDAANHLLEQERIRHLQLRKIKTGLMQDLLTGTVRVKVDEQEAAHV